MTSAGSRLTPYQERRREEERRKAIAILAEKAPPKVEATCFYCGRTFLAYRGMPTRHEEIVEEQLRLNTDVPLATCGSDRCARMDQSRRDAIFQQLHKEKPRDTSKPEDPVHPDQVQGSKAGVCAGNRDGLQSLPGLVDDIPVPGDADPYGHVPDPFA